MRLESYRHPPRVGAGKLVRAAAAPPVVRDIAWKAQVRLTGRYRALCRAGKPDVVAVTAVAARAGGLHLGHRACGCRRHHGRPLPMPMATAADSGAVKYIVT